MSFRRLVLSSFLAYPAFAASDGKVPFPAPHSTYHRCTGHEIDARIRHLHGWLSRQKRAAQRVTVDRLLGDSRVNIARGIHCDARGQRWTDEQMVNHSVEVYRQHDQQTPQTRSHLQQKWTNSTLLLGKEVPAWDLLQLLHFTIDHTDRRLLYTSQFVHCLQVFRGVSRFRFSNQDAQYRRDMQLAALVHDLGKVLTLFGEDDANVDCFNRVLPGTTSMGLDNMLIQWNHDEFGYEKLRQYNLPKRVLAVVRFHSLREILWLSSPTRRSGMKQSAAAVPMKRVVNKPGTWAPGGVVTQPQGYMGAQDERQFLAHITEDDRSTAQFVLDFRYFDQATKNRTEEPPNDVDVDEILEILRAAFPNGRLAW